MTIFSEWITAADAAEMLRSSPSVVKRLAREGRIQTHRIPGSRTKYLFSDVLAYSPANLSPPPPPNRKRTASA